MLEQGKMVGFVFTTDYERARSFYEGKLGFRFVSQDGHALVLHTGKNLIRIAKLPEFTAQRGTVLGWEVENVEATVNELTKKGVTIEKYPWVADKETGIWATPNGDKVAWFKDPDGNVLSVSWHVKKVE